MKTFIYIAFLIIFGSFVFNFIFMDYEQSLWGEENRPYMIGFSAGICALILCFILLKYSQLKENLNRRANQP